MIRLFFDGIKYFQNFNEFGICIKKKIKLAISMQKHKIEFIAERLQSLVDVRFLSHAHTI